jgi:hypothetical protein
VVETLKCISKLIMIDVKKKLGWKSMPFEKTKKIGKQGIKAIDNSRNLGYIWNLEVMNEQSWTGDCNC